MLGGGSLLFCACAWIADLPELSPAPSLDAALELREDAGADADADAVDALEASVDAPVDALTDGGLRCGFGNAFDPNVDEQSSLNIGGAVTSLQLTADEQVAAVSTVVPNPIPPKPWVFTLHRQPSGLYDGERQDVPGAHAALREDGLALVVAPSSNGGSLLKEYGRARQEDMFTEVGDIDALRSFFDKHHPYYVGNDILFLDARKARASDPRRIYRLTRQDAGDFQFPEPLAGLAEGASTPVPTRDLGGLYFSICSSRCRAFRAQALGALRYGAVAELSELGDFRPTWISHNGCRLHGTRAGRPVIAFKLPR